MAKVIGNINQPFYVKVVAPTREEASVCIVLLLGLLQNPEKDLEEFSKVIGVADVRDVINSIGRKLDSDWDLMVQLAKQSA